MTPRLALTRLTGLIRLIRPKCEKRLFLGSARHLAVPPLAVLATALAFTVLAFAYTFPPLTGRVVDDANIIPQTESARITAKLAMSFSASSNSG